MFALRKYKKFNVILHFFLCLLSTIFYCEYLHYYATIIQCQWPELNAEDPVKAIVLADTHLLGSRNGHWFDKLRREWQMHRAFQSAVQLHNPHVVIFLGDIFDEGKWCASQEFANYVKRFSELFDVPSNIQIIVVPGNHDTGFHYSMNRKLVDRFEKAFSLEGVSTYSVKGVHFVGINSMAMHGDDCFLCKPAQDKLKILHRELECSKGVGPCAIAEGGRFTDSNNNYVRPVLLQHFPLYRSSDAHCKDSDAAPEEEKSLVFRERWECLSQTATEELLSQLQPRLVLSGHTHHGCTTLHKHPPEAARTPSPLKKEPLVSEDNEYEEEYYEAQERAALKLVRGSDFSEDGVLIIPELTVPSFSWRNKKDPTFSMITLSSIDHSIYKCEMPREQTVMLLYCLALCAFVIVQGKRWLVSPLLRGIYNCFTSPTLQKSR